jgi:hypothetical protein
MRVRDPSARGSWVGVGVGFRFDRSACNDSASSCSLLVARRETDVVYGAETYRRVGRCTRSPRCRRGSLLSGSGRVRRGSADIAGVTASDQRRLSITEPLGLPVSATLLKRTWSWPAPTRSRLARGRRPVPNAVRTHPNDLAMLPLGHPAAWRFDEQYNSRPHAIALDCWWYLPKWRPRLLQSMDRGLCGQAISAISIKLLRLLAERVETVGRELIMASGGRDQKGARL